MSNSRVFRQLRLLTWKNLLVMRRSIVWTAVQLVTPLLFFFIINFVANNTISEHIASHKFPKLTLNGSVADFDTRCAFQCINIGKRRYEFLYTHNADNASVARVMEGFRQRFDQGDIRIIPRFVPNGRAEMERVLRADYTDQQLCDRKYIGGVYINRLDTNSRSFDYQLWIANLVQLKLSDDYMKDNSPFAIPDGDAAEGKQPESILYYCKTGIFSFQLALDAEYARLLDPSANSTIATLAFPEPTHDKSSMELLLEMSFAIFALMTISVVLHTTREIAAERESGMKDFLMVMGMGRGVFYCSHILVAFAKAFIAILINCIPFMTTLPLINPLLLLVAVLLYALCVIAIAALIASIFRTTNNAIKVSVLVLFLLAILAGSSPPRESIRFCIIASLNPNAALSYAFKAMVESLRRNQPLGFMSMFRESTLVFSYGAALSMLIFDAVALFGITLMLDWLLSSSDSPMATLFACIRGRKSPLNRSSSPRRNEGVEEVDAALETTGADIEATGVVKDWGGGARAVDELSMKAYKGQVTVLLGHNGAGKSTTFAMISGLTPPTEGSIRICGMDIREHLDECQDAIGYCPQGNPLFGLLTVDEHLEFFATLKSVDPAEWRAERESLLDTMKLREKRATNASNLSGGMKRKLCVGMALIGKNRVILLDEPTAGMDPGARRDVEALLETYKKDASILMTTHYTDEAEQLGERIVIMAKGRVVASGTPAFLKHKFSTGYILTLVLQKRDAEREADIMSLLRSHIPEATQKDGVHGLQMEACLPKEDAERFPGLFAALEQQQDTLGVTSFGLSLNTLEHVFLRVGELADPETADDSTANRVQAVLSERAATVASPRRILPRIGALLRKRALYALANKTSFFSQIIVPIGIIVLSANILALLEFASGLDRRLVLSSLPPARFAIFQAGMDPSVEGAVRKALAPARNVEPVTVGESVSSPEEWYLNQTLDRPPYVGGVAVTEGGLTLMHSQVFIHSLPSILTLLDGVRFNVSLSSSLHLYNPTLQKEEAKGGPDLVKTFMTGPVLVMIFSFLTSPFITFPIVDRTTKFAHQQLLTGLSPALFWGTNLLFDAAIFLIGSSLFLLTFWLTDWLVPQLGLLFLLWQCFFVASISFIYTVSYIFATPSKGQIILFIYQVLITLAAFILSSLVEIGILQSQTWTDVVEAIILLTIPSFALCKGGVLIARHEMMVKQLTDVGVLGALAGAPAALPSLWAWESLGRIFTYMLIEGALTAALFFAIQSKHVRRFIFKIWNSIPSGYRAVADGPTTGETIALEDYTDSGVVSEKTACTYPANTFALRVVDLGKRFGKTVALDQVTFGVHPRECFGLLGVNGAGKTTAFSIITGEAFANTGEATVYGDEISAETVRMGYCPQFDALLPELTGRQTLEILAVLHGFKDYRAKANAVLRAVGMDGHGDKRTDKYSGGQRRKLSVGVSILAESRLIILDEPTAGIDPKARRDIWSLLMCVRDESRAALLLTSHSMDECEALCSRIAVLSKGHLVAVGTSQDLKSRYGNSFTLTIVLAEGTDRTGVEERVAKIFGREVKLRPTKGQTLVFQIGRVPGDAWSTAFENALTVAREIQAADFCLAQSSLEQTFMAIAHDEKGEEPGRETLAIPYADE